MDKRYLLAFGMGAASLALGILVVRLLGLGSGIPPVNPPDDVEPPHRSQNLSGPYTHKNLTVYLVHGDNDLTGKTPLTLEEAMDRKLVKVHETSDVNELEIENVSATEEVYVQAGDIVKGGKQDRILSVDLIVPANSGRMPISSFCVEQGRWEARGGESTREFKPSVGMAPSKEIKLAAKRDMSQAEVWQGVAASQSKLSAASNTNVSSSVSRSSLPLTLENEVVRANAEDYIDALGMIVNGKSDVIGFVFAINGEINSADTYASHDLFSKLWPKLLKAAAIEAVSESYVAKRSNVVSNGDVSNFLDEAEKARIATERTVTDRIRTVTRESMRSVLIESHDTERDTWLHRNYLMK
jgi:hypothetical protein